MAGGFEQQQGHLQAERLISQGADVLDLGAQSTRPGADDVGSEEECRRLIAPCARSANNIRPPFFPLTRTGAMLQRLP